MGNKIIRALQSDLNRVPQKLQGKIPYQGAPQVLGKYWVNPLLLTQSIQAYIDKGVAWTPNLIPTGEGKKETVTWKGKYALQKVANYLRPSVDILASMKKKDSREEEKSALPFLVAGGAAALLLLL